MFGFGLVRTGAQILDYNLVKRHQRFSLGAVVAHLNHKGERELRWPDPNDKFTTIASQLSSISRCFKERPLPVLLTTSQPRPSSTAISVDRTNPFRVSIRSHFRGYDRFCMGFLRLAFGHPKMVWAYPTFKAIFRNFRLCGNFILN
jgi:hypothetical protein